MSGPAPVPWTVERFPSRVDSKPTLDVAPRATISARPDPRLPPRMDPLKLVRRTVAERRGTPMRGVPALDPLEHDRLRLGRRREPLAVEQLALERREEALRHGIVVRVAHRPHRGPDSRCLAAKPERNRRVLGALIRVMDHALRPALPERHVERLSHDLPPHT